MAMCTSRPQRYKWIKTLSKKATSTPIAVRVIRETYGYNTVHAIEALPLLTNDDVLMHAEDLGFQLDEIKKLKAELKKR